MPTNLACKIPATKFMANVPTAAECECRLCTVKLKTTKYRRSLHNVANGDVLRYLDEMVHETLGPDAAKVIFPPTCRVCRPCFKRAKKAVHLSSQLLKLKELLHHQIMQAGNAILKDATQTITHTSATTPNRKRPISIDEQDTPVPKRRAENTANSFLLEEL